MSVTKLNKTLVAQSIFYVFKKKEQTAFSWRDFNFEVRQGEIVTLIGASGIGKTTLLRVLSGLHPLEKGEVFIDHASSPVKQPESKVFVVFQDYGFTLLPWLSVRKNIELGRFKSKAEEVIDFEAIRKVLFPGIKDFEKFLDQRPNQLSGGQKQRVQIARAMVSEADFIFFDEPDSGIDYKSKLAIRALLQQLAIEKNKGIILITHDLENAFHVAVRCYVLHKEEQGTEIELMPINTSDYANFEAFREEIRGLL